LREVCELQLNQPAWFNSGLLKVGRTLYVTTVDTTYAVDATTCELRWRHVIDFKGRLANISNRGAGYLDGMIFRGSVDGRLIALNSETGKVIWDVQSADSSRAESFIAAPIAWDGKVFVGIATSDLGVRGRLKAFDAKTGHEIWRFYTIPVGNEPGAETWPNAASITPAGGGFWSSFSLDPATNEVFGPVANPYPDYGEGAKSRLGDNLYTNSVIALNASTGKLNWYHQATPGDDHDWDLGTPPTLYRARNGKSMLAIAGKDGHVLGIDRATNTAVFKTAGTTIANDGPVDGTLKLVCPGSIGGAQWNGTAYHPGTGVLYTGMVDWCFYYSTKLYTGPPGSPVMEEPDAGYPAGGKKGDGGTVRVDFSKQPQGWITAMDGETGAVLWKFHADAQVIAGLVPTKSGLLFAGDTRGNLLALDGKSGSLLKRIDARGALNNGLISYEVDGAQYVAAAVGGLSLNCAGVSGSLRVAVYGLSESHEPKTVTLERRTLPSGAALYGMVCSNCHGGAGLGASAPSLVRQTGMSNPAALKAFLKSVPPPMPILYPGLLEEREVELIADHLKLLTRAPGNGSARGVSAKVVTDAPPAGTPQWQRIYAVLTSARCINCHTLTDYLNQETTIIRMFSVWCAALTTRARQHRAAQRVTAITTMRKPVFRAVRAGMQRRLRTRGNQLQASS
jgi:alcohol dehydrogenase (cytochrome c)